MKLELIRERESGRVGMRLNSVRRGWGREVTLEQLEQLSLVAECLGGEVGLELAYFLSEFVRLARETTGGEQLPLLEASCGAEVAQRRGLDEDFDEYLRR